MLANPRIMSLDNDAAYFTDDILDFGVQITAIMHLSMGSIRTNNINASLKQHLIAIWRIQVAHLMISGALTFHIPYTKLGLKSLRMVARYRYSPRSV
ncbi:hypothetical protein MGH68_00595 [Erysipelothrix sp. D19-032]